VAEVRRPILETLGVADAHDLQVWSLTSGMNVVSAHVVLDDGAQPSSVLEWLATCLSGDFDIEHSAFQLELQDRQAAEEQLHP